MSSLRLRFLVALILFIGLVLSLNFLPIWKLDTTKNQLYTLSDGVKQKLKSLNETIEIRYYYAPELGNLAPQYGIYADRVEDMLRQFKQLGGDKIILTMINPEAFSPLEDDAMAAGLQGIDGGKDGGKLYFGIDIRTFSNQPATVIGAAPLSEEARQSLFVIPFLQPARETFLEYDLIKLIDHVVQKDTAKLGVITSSEIFGATYDLMRGQPLKPWAVISQAREFYQVSQILNAKDLLNAPPDILMIVHPASLAPELLYAIDQFVLAGGKTIIFYDPFHEMAATSAAGSGVVLIEESSNFGNLLHNWGVKIDPAYVIGDRKLGQMVNFEAGGNEAVAYPAWIGIGAEQEEKSLPLFANLEAMMLPSVGAIIPLKGDELGSPPMPIPQFTPILWGSDQSFKIPLDRLEEPNPFTILEGAEAFDGKPIFGALLEGSVLSGYLEGAPSPEPSTDPAANTAEGNIFANHQHLAEGKANIMLIADADMLADNFWVRKQAFFNQEILTPINDNGAFFLNIIDHMSGDQSLTSLRGRGVAKAPFTVIQAMRTEAEQAYRAMEQELTQKLGNLESNLQELREDVTLSQSEDQINQMVDELLITRSQLRQVNHNLRQGVTSLENKITYLVTFAVPLCLLIIALIISFKRRKRTR